MDDTFEEVFAILVELFAFFFSCVDGFWYTVWVGIPSRGSGWVSGMCETYDKHDIYVVSDEFDAPLPNPHPPLIEDRKIFERTCLLPPNIDNMRRKSKLDSG